MAYDKQSFLSMLAAGLVCKGTLAQKEKEPVAYLYGHVAQEGETPTHTIDGVDYVGAVFPDIYTVYTPELQKEYPYALIAFDDYSDPSEKFILATLRLIKSIDYGNSALCEYINFYAGDPVYHCNVYDDEPFMWVDSLTEEDANIRFDAIDWANFDIVCQTDIYANESKPIGAVYCAASDPIPIYE